LVLVLNVRIGTIVMVLSRSRSVALAIVLEHALQLGK